MSYKSESLRIKTDSRVCSIPMDLQNNNCIVRKREQIDYSVGNICEQEEIELKVTKHKTPIYDDHFANNTDLCYPMVLMQIEVEHNHGRCLIPSKTPFLQKCHLNEQYKIDPLTKEPILESVCYLKVPPNDLCDKCKTEYNMVLRENCAVKNLHIKDKANIYSCKVRRNAFFDDLRFFNPTSCPGLDPTKIVRAYSNSPCYFTKPFQKIYCETKEPRNAKKESTNSAKICEDEKTSLEVVYADENHNPDSENSRESCYSNIVMHVRKAGKKGKCVIPENSISIQNCYCDKKREKWESNSTVECVCSTSIYTHHTSSMNPNNNNTLYLRESCMVQSAEQSKVPYLSDCNIIKVNSFIHKPDSPFLHMIKCSEVMRDQSVQSPFEIMLDSVRVNPIVFLFITVFPIFALIYLCSRLPVKRKKKEERRQKKEEARKKKEQVRQKKKETERKKEDKRQKKE